MLRLKRILIITFVMVSIVQTMGIANSIFFQDDFEKGMDKWDLVNPPKVRIIESGDPKHGKILALYPGAPVHALIKNSERWTNVKVEGDVLFPENEHSYMGFIYNYNVGGSRADYGCIYIKGNGSYIRVNPHRDYQVSRTIYEEYKTKLTGPSIIIPGQWQHFKAEIMGAICHFYVGDMETPKITFNFHEYTSGRIGFEPRIYGSECWIDNISANSIHEFYYKGAMLPSHIQYEPEELITQWEVIGPFRRRHPEIEKDGYLSDKVYTVNKAQYTWKPFKADRRGCVVSGRVFEFASQKWFAYFHSKIVSPKKKSVKIGFSSTNRLTVWLNGRNIGEIEPVYNAWYDFWKNPKHKGREVVVNFEKGINHLQILAEAVGRKYSGDGFFAHIE
jgi:hypothetical protein